MSAGSAGMVDWSLAVSLGSRLAGEGPASRATRPDAVVGRAPRRRRPVDRLVRGFTGLEAGERTAPVLVVDRAGWVAANADGFSTVLAPVVEKLTAEEGRAQRLVAAIGSA